MDKGHNFLHNHPMTEKRLGLDEQHVIVDRDAWEHARKQGLNLPIPHVSNRRELYFVFMKEYNALMGESEHQILKEEVEVLLAKYSC